MSLETPKGVRDYLPEDKILRNHIVSVLQETFEIFGYNPIETPALELVSTLTNKFAGGEEILKEMYTLSDNGERELGLRYDLTVPFARVIAQNKSLKFPFKRYHIDRVWRDGPIKLGRYREFWQCDCDVAGAKSIMAEAELMAMASHIFTKLNLRTRIDVNNRKLLDSLLAYAGIDAERHSDAILTIDKLKKIQFDGVKAELAEKGIDVTDKLKTVLEITGTNEEVIEQLEQIIPDSQGLAEIKELLGYCTDFKLDTIKLDISLARGLSYYTGTIFEGFMHRSKIKSSICAGGRFDTMIGKLAESKQDIPAVGISFGLDVLTDAIKLEQKETKKSQVQLFVIPIQTEKECAKLVQQLRSAGIKTDIDLIGRPLSKNMKFAQYYEIPYVLIVGENELAEQKFTLRDMTAGTEEKLPIAEVIKKL